MRPSDEAALSHFDHLPDSANVRLPVVAALFGVSPATVWRWCRSGHLPQPVHVAGITAWNVGALRARLSQLRSPEAAPLGSSGDTARK